MLFPNGRHRQHLFLLVTRHDVVGESCITIEWVPHRPPFGTERRFVASTGVNRNTTRRRFVIAAPQAMKIGIFSLGAPAL